MSIVFILTLCVLLTSFEDPNMNSQDLAFFLATHDFDASPIGDYVEVRLIDKIVILEPNGDEPGLADIVSLKEMLLK